MSNWFEKHILRHTRETKLHPLQKVAIGGLLILTCLSFLENALTPSRERDFDRMLSAVLPGVIVDLTNKERAAENLGTLKRNPLLDEAARLKGNHMKQNNYFAHDSPQGITPWYWFDVAKYDYLHAGENLAVYFDDSEEVVDAWMESPLHKENILKKEYTEIGVAVVEGKYDGYSTYFVVQLFGTPAKKTQAAAVTEKPVVQKIAQVEEPKPITVPANTVLGESEGQKELLEKVDDTGFEDTLDTTSVEILSDEENIEGPTEEIVVPQTSTLVERVQIEDSMVYVSDHASTSTVPVSSSATDNTVNKDATSVGTLTMNSKTLLQILYSVFLIVVVSLIISSIIFSEIHKQHVQVFYGMALLLVTFVLLSFHAQVVTATTSLL